MTEAETYLWLHLRGRRLGEFRFRKQAPIGRYVADFVCLSERLVIEVDGGGHALKTRTDRARDRWLAQNGYRVLRVWNSDVLTNIEGVLTLILSRLEDRGGPLPNPPPCRGRGMLTAPTASARGRNHG